MSIEACYARLRRLSLALPRFGCAWEDRPTFDSPATLQSIIDIEQYAGFSLPADFRTFLSLTNSVVAMSVQNGYWLGGVDQLTHSMMRDDFPRSVDGEPVVPIGTTGCGDAFLLGRTGSVWQWLHETNNLKKVAESFKLFLERIADDWDAYVSNRPNWHFLA